MTSRDQLAPTDRPSAAGDDRVGRFLSVLEDALAYSRERDYTGWDYGDGMSSRLLRWLPVENAYLNIAVQELAKRPPINVRPLLLIEQRRNYKGTALFAMANLNRARLGVPADVDHEAEARDLNDWLLDNRSVGYEGFCGGHKHEIQHLSGRKGVPNDPDVVSTSFAVKSLLSAADVDPIYPAVARTASDFVVEDLNYRPVEGGARIDYHLNHPDDSFTINAGAIGARLFTDLYEHYGEEVYRTRARKILDHVADLQADIGGWTYREPPSSSHLSMDNHHNGFVIEAFQRYHEVVGDGRYDDTLDRALRFYRNTLFDDDGAPNWDESNSYPRDIHASAQGALVFTYAGDLDFAARIIGWVLDNLYAGDGRFYYRKHRLYTTRTTLMRWCQAWMCYAISEYLAAQE